MSFITAFNKEFLEQRRTRRLFVTLIVMVLFGIASPLIAKILPDVFAMIPEAKEMAFLIPTPTMADAITQYLKNISQFGVLLALLFGMGAVAQEKDKGTAALVLSKPMPRGSFLFAKFVALAVIFIIGIMLAAIFGYYYTVYLFGELNLVNWLILNGLLLVYILMFSALTLFFSTLTKTQYVAIGLSFATMIVLGILGSIPGIGKHMPDSLISNAVLVALGSSVQTWTGLWVSLGLIIVSLLSAWLIFRRQEL